MRSPEDGSNYLNIWSNVPKVVRVDLAKENGVIQELEMMKCQGICPT